MQLVSVVCISHGTIEVQRYLVPPFFGPGRTKVVLLVVLGGAVRGSVLGFGVVVAEQYWVIVCNHLNIKAFLLVENFLWISEHEWWCDVFGPRDIWDIFLDLGYFFGFGNYFGEFLWVSEHVRVEWWCDVFGPRDIRGLYNANHDGQRQ